MSEGVAGLTKEEYQELFNGQIRRLKDMFPSEGPLNASNANQAFEFTLKLEKTIRILRVKQHASYKFGTDILEHLSIEEKEKVRIADLEYRVKDTTPSEGKTPTQTKHEKNVGKLAKAGMTPDAIQALMRRLAEENNKNG